MPGDLVFASAVRNHHLSISPDLWAVLQSCGKISSSPVGSWWLVLSQGGACVYLAEGTLALGPSSGGGGASVGPVGLPLGGSMEGRALGTASHQE